MFGSHSLEQHTRHSPRYLQQPAGF